MQIHQPNDSTVNINSTIYASTLVSTNQTANAINDEYPQLGQTSLYCSKVQYIIDK